MKESEPDSDKAEYHALVYDDSDFMVRHWIKKDGKTVWEIWAADDEDISKQVEEACAKYGAESPLV